MRGEPFIAPPDQQGLGFGEKRLPPAGHQAHPPKPERKGEPIAFHRSCRCYGHDPVCVTYLDHLRRLDGERTKAGGEAELKAACRFWERLEGAK